MKIWAPCIAVAIAFTASAQPTVRARLVGQRLIESYPGAPILVCRYTGPRATYEVVASTPSCAPYLDLE